MLIRFNFIPMIVALVVAYFASYEAAGIVLSAMVILYLLPFVFPDKKVDSQFNSKALQAIVATYFPDIVSSVLMFLVTSTKRQAWTEQHVDGASITFTNSMLSIPSDDLKYVVCHEAAHVLKSHPLLQSLCVIVSGIVLSMCTMIYGKSHWFWYIVYTGVLFYAINLTIAWLCEIEADIVACKRIGNTSAINYMTVYAEKSVLNKIRLWVIKKVK